MPLKQDADRSKPALALSGGGFRATLFHLGTMIRLNELGYLQGLERISSVSGGAITAALLARKWARLDFQDGIATNFHEEVTQPIRLFCRRLLDVSAITRGVIHPTKSVGNVTAEIYDEWLDGMLLQDLPRRPQFLFNTTNIQTGRTLRIMKTYLADYTVGQIREPNFSVGTAVAASAAFPPVLSPVVIKFDPEGWRLWGDVRDRSAIYFKKLNYKKQVSLMDGGAYDNLGLETVDDFKTIIASDAGAPFVAQENASATWPAQALRALDIATDQARGMRKQMLFAQGRTGKQKIAYAGIDIPDRPYGARSLLRVNKDTVASLARIRTRLDPFSDEEQGKLINWGWYQTDLAMRTYIVPDAQAPTQWPIRDWRLDRAVAKPRSVAAKPMTMR